MVSGFILERTFHIRYSFYEGGKTDIGTGFTLEYNRVQYLISVKHTFGSAENGSEISFELFRDDKWLAMPARVYFHSNQEVDIAVLKLTRDISARTPVAYTIGCLGLGLDAYFIGFPLGMMMKDYKANNGYPIPYVKKGALTAFGNEDEDKGVSKLFFDGINNKGFSGGPVFYTGWDELEKPFHHRQARVCGVIKGFVANVINHTTRLGENIKIQENSGIIEAHSIKHVQEILEQNKLV